MMDELRKFSNPDDLFDSNLKVKDITFDQAQSSSRKSSLSAKGYAVMIKQTGNVGAAVPQNPAHFRPESIDEHLSLPQCEIVHEESQSRNLKFQAAQATSGNYKITEQQSRIVKLQPSHQKKIRTNWSPEATVSKSTEIIQKKGFQVRLRHLHTRPQHSRETGTGRIRNHGHKARKLPPRAGCSLHQCRHRARVRHRAPFDPRARRAHRRRSFRAGMRHYGQPRGPGSAPHHERGPGNALLCTPARRARRRPATPPAVRMAHQADGLLRPALCPLPSAPLLGPGLRPVPLFRGAQSRGERVQKPAVPGGRGSGVRPRPGSPPLPAAVSFSAPTARSRAPQLSA